MRSDRLRHLLCWFIQLYIRFVYLTNRWTVEGGEIPRRLRDSGQSFILAFWHGRLLMIPMAWQRLAPMHMLISAHRDGRIIADAVTYFGVNSIAGSTRRGGSAALRQMLKQLAAGDCVGITPDGPRGPAMRASIGIVNVARLARVPIVPVVFATRRRRASEIPELLSPLLAVVPVQILAQQMAVERQANPDRFRKDDPRYNRALSSLAL